MAKERKDLKMKHRSCLRVYLFAPRCLGWVEIAPFLETHHVTMSSQDMGADLVSIGTLKEQIFVSGPIQEGRTD